MKATNNYLLIAREITADAADAMVSIFKIIEKFTFGIDLSQLGVFKNQTIVLPANYAIGTSWSFDEPLSRDSLLTVKISVIDPEGKILPGPEQENLITKGLQKVNLNFNSAGIPVTSAGKYTLHAELITSSKTVLAKEDFAYEVELIEGRPTSS